MSLITCSECKRQISDMADKCPNCGKPNVEPVSNIYITNNRKGKGKQLLGKGLLIFGLLCLLGKGYAIASIFIIIGFIILSLGRMQTWWNN